MFGKDYKIGDVIRQELPGGGSRLVRVTDRLNVVKNGLPGFHGVVVDGNGNTLQSRYATVWGYDYEVREVLVRSQ